MTEHLYIPKLRPASFSTLPQGLAWEYVEAPSYITKRPDLPRSAHPHGLIRTERALTADELNSSWRRRASVSFPAVTTETSAVAW